MCVVFLPSSDSGLFLQGSGFVCLICPIVRCDLLMPPMSLLHLHSRCRSIPSCCRGRSRSNSNPCSSHRVHVLLLLQSPIPSRLCREVVPRCPLLVLAQAGVVHLLLCAILGLCSLAPSVPHSTCRSFLGLRSLPCAFLCLCRFFLFSKCCQRPWGRSFVACASCQSRSRG